jgi:HPt (histidine-containing phosphotransfer) domain-containing protein
MPPTKTQPPKVTSFGDHEVITPPHSLKDAVRPGVAGDDPVARAEAALAKLSTEFSGWMNDECARLDAARQAVRQHGLEVLQREALFRAAHDIKGHAPTLGFPLVADVAGGLCRLIEETRDPRCIPPELIDQHVDTIRALIREHGLVRGEVVAAELSRTLRAVTDEFLKREGKDSDGPPLTASPPIAPVK